MSQFSIPNYNNSCSGLRGKMFKSARDLTSFRTAFRNGNQVKNLEYLKTGREFFSGTFIFAKIWVKKAKNSPKL